MQPLGRSCHTLWVTDALFFYTYSRLSEKGFFHESMPVLTKVKSVSLFTWKHINKFINSPFIIFAKSLLKWIPLTWETMIHCISIWTTIYLSPCLLTLYAEYIMRNTGLEEAQAGINIAGRNVYNLRYADDTTLMAESEEELKSLLMESKRGEWKSWLKAQHSENTDHGIWSHHFMGNRWWNSGKSGWLYFWGLQNHCRWWLQPWN